MAGINEEIFQENDMDSIELENIFMNIFRQCDNENNSQVEVSTLIKFISPFVGSNDEHLFELKKLLDPVDINPIISYDQFSNAMKIWTEKFNSQLQTNFASENSITNKRLSDHGLKQSTPTKESVERGTNKNDFDCGLNISNISSYSYAGSVQSACDPIYLNEQINELQYQCKKLQGSLNEVRGQFTTSEELNHNMQVEMNELKKSRQSDQKIIEELQKVRIEFDKEREEHNDLIKNHNSIIKSLNFYKKENSQLRKDILEYEKENQKSHEIISSLRHKESKQTNKIEKCNHEIEIKNNEILMLQEKFVELNTIYTKKDSYIKEISEELQTLRNDNNTLQKCLDDVLNKNTFSKPDFIKSGKKSSSLISNRLTTLRSSTPEQPFKISLKFDSPIFNSPKMLNMLSDPVSPINNYSSIIDSSHSSKSTVIEQQQQVFSLKINNSETRVGSFICLSPTRPGPQKIPVEINNLNHTSSSIDSETNPEKQSIPLGPNVGFDDDNLPENSDISRRSQSPHESLQAELIKASYTDCFGLNAKCEHMIKLIQFEEENENLTNQIHKYIEENNKIKQSITEINRFNTELQHQISLMKENKVQNEKEIQQYTQEINSKVSLLREIKKQNEKEIENYIEEINNMKKNLTEKNNLNSELQNKISLLTKNVNQDNTEVQSYIEEINIMKANITELNNLNTGLQNQISLLNKNKVQFEKDIQKYVEENNIIKNHLIEIKNSNTQLQNQISLLSENKTEYEKEIKQYIEEINNITKNLNEKNKLNSQLQNKISALTENIKQSEQEVLKYLEENNKINERLTEMNKLNADLKSQISRLSENQKHKEKLREQMENYEQLQKDNEEISTLNVQLKSDMASMKSENKRYSRFQQKLKKLEKEIFDEKSKSESILQRNNNLQLKLTEVSSALEIIEREKIDLENQLSEKTQKVFLENKELKTNINELSMKISHLEQEKQQLKKKLSKEETNSKELQSNIKELFSKIAALEQTKLLLKEQLGAKEITCKDLHKLTTCNEQTEQCHKEDEIHNLAAKLNDSFSKIEILKQTKNQLQEELSIEKEITNDLKLNLNKVLSEKDILQQTNQDLENKLLIEKTSSDELKLKIRNLSQNIEISEQEQSHLKEKLNKAENTVKEFKYKINEVNKSIEILEQTNYSLEDQLLTEENKYQSLKTIYNDIHFKNIEFQAENNKVLSKNKALLTNINNLEQKIQNFRKANIDLNTIKNEVEKNQKITLAENTSLKAHINFTQQQIKECICVLGKNTLLATRMWKYHLDSIMEDIPVSDLTDESALSGMMPMCAGKLTDDMKDLKNQARLTGILLLSLAKIKENQILDDDRDEDLSDVFIPDSRPLITQSVFSTNSSSFYIPKLDFSCSSSSNATLASMSPECEFNQSEMTDDDIHFSQTNVDVDVELTDSGVNISLAGSSYVPQESVVQNGAIVEKDSEVDDNSIEEVAETSQKQKPPLKQYRSMSEGTTLPPQFTENGDITLFPNLQDNILESLGLQNGDQSRNRPGELLTEEEIEAKFQTLALIFAIDSKTIAQRRELQRRQRDLADDNFATEVAKLEHGIHRLAPLCIDAEIKELVTALLTRLNIIVKAAQRISISTQVYGGVQQEFRVAAAVNLMLVHLRNVQQQRDTVKRQLQCTKKMLQENNNASSEASTGVVSVVSRRMSSTANGRVVTRRRASIASLPRPLDSPSASGPAGIAAAAKRAVRRISADAYSEQSVRPWDSKHRPEWIPLGSHPLPTRLSRPSRIELGLDLSKIHEGSVETTLNNSETNEESDSDVGVFVTPTAILPTPNIFLEHQPIVQEPETFCDHVINILTALVKFVMYCWNRWMKNGTTREIILFVMIFFFGLSSIVMLNIMIMSKFLEQGTVIQKIPWGWLTWDEFWNIFFDFRNI